MPVKRKRVESASLNITENEKLPISAFAAARLRAEVATEANTPAEVIHEEVPVPSSLPPASPDSITQSLSSEDVKEDESELDLRTEHPVKLCSWRNDAKDVLADTDSELIINLNKSDTIALIGCFDFIVARGAININGANIGAISREGRQNQSYRVFVPNSHPILKIRGLDGTNHIKFMKSKMPVPLGGISPLFEDIWHAGLSHAKDRSYSIITESTAYQLSHTLSPEIIPDDWFRAVEDCTASRSTTLVTGRTSMGKSTFATRLINRFLTGLGKTIPARSEAFLLDLDHRHQEYAPNGQISLIAVKDLNLGPDFTHPATLPDVEGSRGNKLIRAHPIPANFSIYGEYYHACAIDLFETYINLNSRSSSTPLVIKASGHLHDSNFDILTKLMDRIKPQNIIHLCDKEALDIETTTNLYTIRTASSRHGSTVHEITALKRPIFPTESEQKVDIMHMQSYLHMKSSNSKSPKPHNLTWTATPLSDTAPWEFCYQETNDRMQDFVGFAMYTEPIEPASIIHALNGSIVHIILSTSSVIPESFTNLTRTPRSQVPYFPRNEHTGMVEPLDPKTSEFICTAMIRGFDPDRRMVQILVPSTHEILLHKLVPEQTVLVFGCCDTPEWAFVEGLYVRRQTGRDMGSQLEEDIGSDVPWVERKSVMDEMGYLNTLRRVRKFQT